ncbi:MAG: divalent-cation tolerance protein CutA [Thermoplasmata archaeon]
MRKPQVVIIYTTTKDVKEAKKIGKTLVDRKLAACVNIIPKMNSVYRWKGSVEEAKEAVLLVKTTDSNVEKVKKSIVKMHSYELPCILVFPVESGLGSYLKYIVDNSKN